MEVRIEIKGLREIQRAMLQLPQRLDNKLLNQGLIAGARVVRDEARRRAPVLKMPDPRRRAGTLRRSIRAMRIRPPHYAATAIYGGQFKAWDALAPATKQRFIAAAAAALEKVQW